MDNKARFVLGQRGENPLICIGVNPSTATPEKLDPTLIRVRSRAKQLGYDGWMMLNLYPQRAANPDDLHDEPDRWLHKKNKRWIYRYLGLGYTRQNTIWAAWGTLIEKRGYLEGCLRSIVDDSVINHNWITIGKRSKAGHPHHPLYLPNKAEVGKFDIEKYLESFKGGESL